jgi:hypothetical protein
MTRCRRFRNPGLAALAVAFLVPVWGCTESIGPTEAVTSPKPSAIVIFPNVQIFDEAGQELQFTARVQDQYGFSVTWVPVHWSTSDQSVVTVTSSGLVKALDRGEAEITVTASEGSLKAVSKVTVK